ncbi:MAG TPA: 50S ribosomal protein L11 methyltransferase [Oligoflexus sp.]|uniref:50S ribosomal protein L11 methyltransferase n=1 Tax=Oligoflexus sp. TaxID=1971216 RepID=UPI002D80E3D6|nr:50S ribosomal protein L11 methyltransferase [Oligoflexus sp.]HET9239735.1 50S ribosomal protein L11 methyltransferase [Oligoflexus sp.]
MEVIELTLTPQGCREALVARLEELGFTDYIEGSCDQLDADDGEEQAWVDAFERGALELPLVIYSYDESVMLQLVSDLKAQFGQQLDIQWRRIADAIWQTAWEPAFEALTTERFFISDHQAKQDPGSRQRIRLESGLVFGSGQHATTQAMVRLMEKVCAKPAPGSRFLDVGTGTGVLALVAHYLGYADLMGTDIEPEALAVARRNQSLNAVPFPLIEGSLPPADEVFETIACNILPPTLTHLLPALQQRLKAGGLLLLAGFHEANVEPILRAAAALGMKEAQRIVERGWIALALTRQGL